VNQAKWVGSAADDEMRGDNLSSGQLIIDGGTSAIIPTQESFD
jgi:hypothetical protein